MEFNERLHGLVQWGHALSALLEEYDSDEASENSPLSPALSAAYQANKWFTPANSLRSLRAIAIWLDKQALTKWTDAYPGLHKPVPVRSVGIVMAGNLPAVGFHDLLSVLVCGHEARVRFSSDDQVLIPFLLDILFSVEPRFRDRVKVVSKITDIDAVIATGSNNTARYFEYYFSAVPHVIRRNRHGVAVLKGDEKEEELRALGDDVFSYFGLGCRNVSMLYVPQGYDFGQFFEAMEAFGEVIQHNKYMNNYDYHRAVYLLNSQPFLTNNFLIVREDESIHTPVSVLHYTHYVSEEALKALLARHEGEIQCIVGHGYLPFGTAQQPGLGDYADGVDTIRFLLEWNSVVLR